MGDYVLHCTCGGVVLQPGSCPMLKGLLISCAGWADKIQGKTIQVK